MARCKHITTKATRKIRCPYLAVKGSKYCSHHKKTKK